MYDGGGLFAYSINDNINLEIEAAKNAIIKIPIVLTSGNIADKNIVAITNNRTSARIIILFSLIYFNFSELGEILDKITTITPQKTLISPALPDSI